MADVGPNRPLCGPRNAWSFCHGGQNAEQCMEHGTPYLPFIQFGGALGGQCGSALALGGAAASS